MKTEAWSAWMLPFIIAALVTFVPAISPADESVAAALTSDIASWTIMVYMAADVANTLPWERDINEMEAAHQASGTNVVALVDPPGASDTMLLKIEHDENLMDSEFVSESLYDGGEVIQGEGDVNTGDPATLTDFMVFSAREYPADNLVLILWGHGIGWRGMCPDGSDLLTLPELRSALAGAEAILGHGVDLMVLDVCAGATMELAYEICDYVEMLVGSELSVSAEGLPYTDVLNALAAAPDQSIEDFGRATAESYVEWASYGSTLLTVVGLFNLNLAEEMIDRLDSTSAIGTRFDRLYHDSLTEAAHSSEHTEVQWSMDFGGFSTALCAEALPLEVRWASMEMALAYAAAVMYLGESNSEEREHGVTTGLSLYSPSDDLIDESYFDLMIATTAWPDLSARLRNDSSTHEGGPSPVLAAEDSIDDADDLPDAAALTWETDDVWIYSSFEVHVYGMQSDGLVYYREENSTTPEISFSGITGSLLISASALVDDEVYSHAVFNTTLYGSVRIEMTVRDGGILCEDDFEITLTSQAGVQEMVECRNGTCAITIVVPEWADAGDLILVQVADTGGGAVLSERTIRISGEDMLIALDIHRPDSDSTDVKILAGLATISALLVASALLYSLRGRRR